ncbi:HEAT repeats [Candidatus Anstonella stagnisolia]|nr:HEAT repeats [Candidatus Anstonella stagnisolia]
MVELVEGIQKTTKSAEIGAQDGITPSSQPDISEKEWISILVREAKGAVYAEKHIALEELAKIGSPKAALFLANAALGHDAHLCGEAIKALEKYSGPYALPILELASHRNDWAGKDAQVAHAKLKWQLEYAKQFWNKGEEELRQILENPGTQRRHDRWKAAKQLATRRTPTSVAILIGACTHEEWDVRHNAITALGCIDDARVEAALRKTAESDKSDSVRAAAKTALASDFKLPIRECLPSKTGSAAREIETAARKAKLVQERRTPQQGRRAAPIGIRIGGL